MDGVWQWTLQRGSVPWLVIEGHKDHTYIYRNIYIYTYIHIDIWTYRHIDI